MKLAVRENMTPGATLAEKLQWLEELGVDGIELEGESLNLSTEELKRVFGRSRIRVANVPGNGPLLDPDPHKRSAAKDLVRERLKLARTFGSVGVLIVPQFGSLPGLPDLSPYRTAVELENELLVLQLRELAPAAEEAGVPIFLEPLNRYEAHLINRLEQGVAIAEQVGPQIKIMADFFHMGIEEADIASSIRTSGSHIIYVHVADSNRLQPGLGHLDFRPGFAALKSIGYDGYLGIECRVKGERKEALAQAATLLRGLWAES